MNLDLKKLVIIAKTDGLTTTDSFVKMTEEVGELAAAHLCKQNCANKSKSSSPNTLEEAVDVFICAMDYLVKDGVTEEQLKDMLAKKLDKWERKIFGPKENVVANS